MNPTMTITDLELSQVFPSPLNPREEVGDEQPISEMAESLREKGLLQPLLVVPHPSREGDYEVLIGHRRLAAAKRLGWSSITCEVVTDRFSNDADKIAVMLTENIHRADLTAVEEGQAMQQMLNLPGYSYEKVAKATSMSMSTVRRRIQLLDAGEEVLAAVKAKEIDLFQAEEIAKYAGEDDLVEDLTAAAESGQTWKWDSAKASAERAFQWRQDAPKVYDHLTKLGYDFLAEEEADSNAFRSVGVVDLPGLSWRPSELLKLTNHIIPAEIFQEHGKEGLRPCLNHRTKSVTWFVPASEDEVSAPEPTAEEIAEKAAREKAETALRIDRASAQKYLEELVGSPAKVKGAAHKALAFCMANAGAETTEYARLVGVELNDSDLSYVERREAYFDAFLAFTADQLATAMALEGIGSENGFKWLFQLDELSPSIWDFKLKQGKLALLAEVYGLEESAGLRLAREYWEPALPGTEEADQTGDEVNF